MRLIQFLDANGERRVGVVESATVREIGGARSMRELAMGALHQGQSLDEQALAVLTDTVHDYSQLLAQQRVLAPLDHDDPAHCLVSGTGLTHWGSADARDRMHARLSNVADQSTETDSMRMFRWGVEGGKPAPGEVGAQPEWFYKGDGGIVVRPGQALHRPWYAQDGGDEAEVVGLYLIGPGGRPYRLGFALGNEFSDHVMERRNYLYLAHSKLRECSFGPELRTGSLPARMEGKSRIVRGTEVVWEKPFACGEENMCHSIANLEHHHFKYTAFRREGDVHVHYLGAATLSFSDDVRTQDGDRFEVSLDDFGAPLSNTLRCVDEVESPCATLAL
jgi:hypothetical protein